MHTDDHILEQFIAAKHPLPALATHLGMTLIALVQWVDRNADLLAVAKRAMETHIAFLALKAEAAALIDLTQVSTSTTNEERKRKSASQLLRHSAKRLLTAVGSPSSFSPQGGEKVPSTEGARGMRGSASALSTNPTRERGAPCVSVSPLTPSLASTQRARSDVPSAHSLTNLAGSRVSNAECPTPNALPFTDHEIDVLMATLANHFNIDLSPDTPDPAPA